MSAHPAGMPGVAPTTLQEFFATCAPARAAFIAAHINHAQDVIPIGEDWGTRRYFRVRTGAQSFILMESVPDHFPFAAPGHRIADFIRIAGALRAAGLHAPRVIAADEAQGYVLLDDMGDVSFFAAVEQGMNETSVYALATDVQVRMQDAFTDNTLNLPRYRDTHVHKGRRRVIDWYAPLVRGSVNPDGMVDDYLCVWDDIERNLPRCAEGFVHGDYHLQNLMWVAGEDGLSRCGILDFQGAMWGPIAYDMANLIGDIRRDVPRDVADMALTRRMTDMDGTARESFAAWTAVLMMQFHCRIVGQVIRLASVSGKPAHLRHMPRIQHYIREGLKNPVLTPLAAWFAGEKITFDTPPVFDDAAIRTLIRPDAF